jgi:hypothetical protein
MDAVDARQRAGVTMALTLPLSRTGDPAAFAVTIEAYRAALEAQRSGKPGVVAPASSFDFLIARVPRGDPLPDAFQVVPYTIVDDTPLSPEAQKAIGVLRETIGG